jgi:hypothetical protein
MRPFPFALRAHQSGFVDISGGKDNFSQTEIPFLEYCIDELECLEHMLVVSLD